MKTLFLLLIASVLTIPLVKDGRFGLGDRQITASAADVALYTTSR